MRRGVWVEKKPTVTKETVKQLIQQEKKKAEQNRAKLMRLLERDISLTNLVNETSQNSILIKQEVDRIIANDITGERLIQLKQQIQEVLEQCVRGGRIVNIQRLVELNDQELETFMTELGFYRRGYRIDFVETLPFFVYEVKEGAERDMCSVCYEDYENGVELVKLDCAHVFHKKCISQWLRLKKSCPLCKQEVKPNGERKKKPRKNQAQGNQAQNNAGNSQNNIAANNSSNNVVDQPNRSNLNIQNGVIRNAQQRNEPPENDSTNNDPPVQVRNENGRDLMELFAPRNVEPGRQERPVTSTNPFLNTNNEANNIFRQRNPERQDERSNVFGSRNSENDNQGNSHQGNSNQANGRRTDRI